MTVFQTPDPIAVSVEFGVGDLRLLAGAPGETLVEVTPTNPADKGDLQAAAQTQVEHASGSLVVRGPRHWRQWTPWGGRASVDVEIRLPEGSSLSADLGIGAVHCTGRLGDVDVKTGMGDVRVDSARHVRIRTGFGEVTLATAEGDAELKTGSGRIDVGSVGGAATVKNSNGGTRIGTVEGRAQVQNANGAIQLDGARSDVTARTALGDVRLGALSQGATEAKTAYGHIEIGVLDGVAAWLDLSTSFGRVDNELEATGRPASDERTTEIRAHTAMGDISVRRVPAPA
jgi:hypothetical protein